MNGQTGQHTQTAQGEAQASQLSWQEMAASAYRAYAASTGNKNFRGDPMPAFDALPAAIQVAWEAAVRQVGICLEYGDRAVEAEAGWQDWLPPTPDAFLADKTEEGNKNHA